MSAGRARTGIPNTDDLRRIFAEARSIAVVGASADPDKPGHSIPAYLQRQGYTVVPVNPKGGELFGERVVASLNDLEQPVDVVEVFRPPEEAADIARARTARRDEWHPGWRILRDTRPPWRTSASGRSKASTSTS
jgi:predicted CoA-binding protein